ncbi:MAG: amidohydrolase [Candidatus Thorarchaeota archaeon]|nr:amidohydrolase [Candidatus Thorarchaeota archaeon]
MVETTLIEGGLVVTGDEKGTIIENGFIQIRGSRITYVGKSRPKEKADSVVDAKGSVVIPGLITAHTHLYGILLRGANLNIKPPTDFAQILQRVWWPVDEALTLEDAYASALSASSDMMLNGSTFFADTYSGPHSIESSLDSIAKATNEVGIRAMLAFEMTERHTKKEGQRGLKENIRFVEKSRKMDLVSVMMSIHASFTVTDDLIESSVQEASRLEIPLTVHTSEGLVDLYHNLENYGERTVERLHRLGVLKPRTVLAHCVHLNDHELDLIAKNDASVAHNPMSNMLNAVGTAPVPEMLKRGITVGIGNDGWIFDPFENMRCALTVHRLSQRNPSIIGPQEVFRMATLNGAKCYGLDDHLGSLEEGKLADVVVLDASRVPTPINKGSVIGHLVNTFAGRDVRDVIIDGKQTVRNSQLVKVNQQYITDASRKAAEALWSRLV